MRAHIHVPEDGRGRRKVLVDGVELDACFYADTKRGIARCYDLPYVVEEASGELKWHERCGLVEVFHDDGE